MQQNSVVAVRRVYSCRVLNVSKMAGQMQVHIKLIGRSDDDAERSIFFGEAVIIHAKFLKRE